MTLARAIAREEAITDALRAADAAIGSELPTQQALRIIAALKRLRPASLPKVIAGSGVDYLERVQRLARQAWSTLYDPDAIGPQHDATAAVQTPIGILRAVVWRTEWQGQKRRQVAWRAEYYLDDAPVTVREIRQAGLAQRPTSRNRRAA